MYVLIHKHTHTHIYNIDSRIHVNVVQDLIAMHFTVHTTMRLYRVVAVICQSTLVNLVNFVVLHIIMSLFTSIHRVRVSVLFCESVKLSVYNFDITVGVALLHWGSHSRGLLRKVRRLSAKYSTIENANG